MATGQQAIERVAEVVGDRPTTLFRAAKAMREASQGSLWPQSSRGGGKGAIHIEPYHLVNLVLAVSACVRVTDAPKFVPFYRALIPNKPEEHVLPEGDEGSAANLLRIADVFSGQQSLGTALDRLVDLLTKDEAPPTLEDAGLYIELCINRLPHAYVSFRTFDGEQDHEAPLTKWLYTRANTPGGQPYWNTSLLPSRLIERTALIPCKVFSLLAPLWIDTQDHIAARESGRLSVAASGSAAPEYETAAPLAGDAAALRNQPHTEGKRPGRQTPRKLGERERLSKRSVAALPEE